MPYFAATNASLRLTCATLVLLLASDTHAATIVWANVGSTWTASANWSGGIAPANSTVTDIASFGSGTAVNPNLSVQANINGIIFQSGASGYTFGGSILTIGSSGISNSATGAETFSNGVRISTAQSWSTASGGTLVLNSTADLNSSGATARTLTISGAGNTTFNGVLQNSFAGSTGNLALIASGILTLAGANTYNGTTTLGSGILNVNSTTALGTSTLVIAGGTLDNTSGTALTLTNNNTQTWGGDFTFAGTNNLNLGSGAVALGSNRQVTISAGTLTVGGVISGSGFGLTKAGVGTLALGGSNAYTGATAVSAGTLAIYGSLAAASTVTVNSGGTLAGIGTVSGAVAISTGGTIAPGASPGTLTLGGNLTLNGGSTLTFEFSGSAQDQLVLSGTNLTLAGPASGQVTINLLDYDGTAVMGSYTLISIVGTVASATNWNLGSFNLVAPSHWSQSYLSLGLNGHDLELTLIPEPSTAALAVGTLALLHTLRLRRHRGRDST
jgi:fibronectin-binding autotransporter adhesin